MVIVSGRLPVLETVNVLETAWPTVTWPKLRLCGLMVTWLDPATAVAVSVTVAVPSGPVTAMADESAAAVAGVYVTGMTTETPGLTVAPVAGMPVAAPCPAKCTKCKLKRGAGRERETAMYHGT